MTVIKKRFRSLFRASLLFICVFTLMDLTEYIIAGRCLPYVTLAGMAIVAPIMTFLTFISTMITSGTTSLYSYAVGRSDRENSNRIFSQGVVLAIFLGVLISLLLYGWGDFLLELWGAEPKVLKIAEEYYTAFIPRPAFYFLDYLLMCVLMVEGESRLCILSCLLQFVMGLCLGLYLCPLMGVLGLSIATTVSLVCSVLIKVSCFFLRPSPIEYKFYCNYKDIIRVLRFSVPSALQPLLQMLLTAIVTAYAIHVYDTETLVIYTVVLRLQSLGISISDAVTEAFQPMLCIYYAEKNFLGLKKILYYGLKCGIIGEIILVLAVIFGRDYVTVLFGIEGAGVYVGSAVIPAMLGMPVFMCVHVFAYYCAYIGRKRYSILLQTLLLFVLPLLTIFFLAPVLDAASIWWSTALGSIASLLILILMTRASAENTGGILLLSKGIMDRQRLYEYQSNPQEVVRVSKEIMEASSQLGIPHNKAYRLALMVEELSLNVAEKLGKNVAVETTLKANGDDVYLMMRTYAPLRNFTNENMTLENFRQYIVTQLANSFDEEGYVEVGRESRIIMKV